MRQLEAGDFNSNELTKRLKEVLADESQKNEILKLTGESGVLMMECLDKVSESDCVTSADSLSRSR